MEPGMAENLPSNHLASHLRGSLMTALGQGFSLARRQRLVTLPIPEIRKVLAAERRLLGAELTRHECDHILKDLALVLPRASLDPEGTSRMLDLYYGLLREAGVTGQMLQEAAKRYVMAPTKGKQKWFPDPGQLVEACAEDLAQRKAALAVLKRAALLLDNTAGQPEEAAEAQGLGEKLHDLAESLRARRPMNGVAAAPEPERPSVRSARTATDVAELKEKLAARMARLGQ
jgi:hypothetical protein